MRHTIRLALAAAVAAATLVFAGAAPAVTNGVPDGTAHPYVGAASGDVPGGAFCSGTLLSPTVFLTAGHCTAAFEESFGSYGVKPSISFDPNASPGTYVTGVPHTYPGFFNVEPQGVGVPASIGGDFGVVVLDHAVSLTQYGRLPAVGLLDSRTARSSSYTLVGYGAQDWAAGIGGRFPLFSFVRTTAPTSLVNTTYAVGDEFARFSTSPGGDGGGIGPGDSGAPVLVESGPTVAAIGSHVTNPFASGEAYFTRIDTPAALAFIRSFLH
jgi:hypothetical protein